VVGPQGEPACTPGTQQGLSAVMVEDHARSVCEETEEGDREGTVA